MWYDQEYMTFHAIYGIIGKTPARRMTYMDEALLHDTILRISKMELCFDRLREASEANPAALKEDPIL